MVTFKANVYHEDNDNLIGAEVIVYDGNTPIDSILITSKSSYDELMEEIRNLSSDFVSFRENSELSGQTIEDILSNSGNEIIINASLLNGHSEDYYAKASQISEVYNYNISLSEYNINVGTEVTVTVKVTKQNGVPVANQALIVTKNGDNNWRPNAATNSNGIYKTTFTPGVEDVGLVTFGVENHKVSLNVQGWVTLYSGRFGEIKTNGELVSCYFISASRTINPGNWTEDIAKLSAIGIDSKYYPPNTIYQRNNANVDVRLNPDGTLDAVSRSGNTITAQARVYAVYLMKDI